MAFEQGDPVIVFKPQSPVLHRANGTVIAVSGATVEVMVEILGTCVAKKLALTEVTPGGNGACRQESLAVAGAPKTRGMVPGVQPKVAKRATKALPTATAKKSSKKKVKKEGKKTVKKTAKSTKGKTVKRQAKAKPVRAKTAKKSSTGSRKSPGR